MKKLIVFGLLGSLVISPAIAGQGFFITINNKSDNSVTTSVSNVNCMYGTENLNIFLPANTQSQMLYVETKLSGSCIFQALNASHYTLRIQKSNSESVDIKYRACSQEDGFCGYGNYFKSSNPDIAAVVDVQNGDQIKVKIHVY